MTAPHETTGLEIAVIGMAGRFPHASSVDALWQKLQGGTECISRFSDEEMAAAQVAPALESDPNYVNAGGVLEGAELFDAAFFGYSPREASLLDPQHRLLLETAWTALEHAGYAPGTFDGPVGVYGGVGANDYFLKHVHAADSLAPREVIQLANEKDFLATRISYKLNLKGPSLVVQTACSTSLVAIHLACQGLIAGECDMALAGGVTIRLPQQSGYLFQEAGILSPDGHCRAFSARAQGCLPGNGGAIVVLKRLADAVADGDCIQAVIKGSAINNDGAFKVGYTAPGVEGQTRVIRSALGAAGISAETIGYLEAHGTGTVLGDPIEIQAATQAYRQDTDKKQYCAIGSIKANLGHLDAGAGVAGFIKAVLALKHGTLPPTIHGDPPNPAIDFPNSPFFVNSTLRPWAQPSGPRRAAVSSFGIGGTNAHVVLEEPPDAPTASGTPKTAELLILSARSERALDESAANLAAHLRAQPAPSLADVALTLRCGRSSMPHRRAVVCRDIEEAAAALEKSSGRRSRSEASTSARLIFMFPGQGSQYPAMGRELYATQPVFRRHVDAAAEILRPSLGFDLRQIVSGAVSDEAHTRLRDTRIAQPAIFTVSHALAQLVMSWGLQPAAMIGHSIGEYVAACLSGVFSFEDALQLVQARGQLMGAVPAGSMMAVALSADALEPLLPQTLALAAINAPTLSVVSGPADVADAFARELRERGIDVRPLQTSHAFHSPAMEPILEDFTARVRMVQRREPAIPFVSNLTGTWISPAEAIDPLYWARHLRQTVRFSAGLQKVLEMRGAILLELGPGQTLTTLARRHVREGQAGPAAFPTTRRADDPSADSTILDTLGGLWTGGIDIDWRRVQTNPHARRVVLPTYPFQRERFWLEPSTGPSPSSGGRRSDLADWFSVQSWERLPERGMMAGGHACASDGAPGLRKLWIVFADAFGLGEGLGAQLRATGGDVVTVTAASEYARRSDCVFELSPGVTEHYQRLCEALGRFGREHLRIVHCWTVEPDESVRRGRTHLEDYQDRGFYSLLFLAQALGAQRWLNSCRITAVSSHVHEVIGTELLCPEKATIAGPLKVIPLEYDRFACAQVDVVLPAEGTESIQAVTDLVIDALDRPDDAIAVRGRHLWRPKIVPLRLDRSETVPLLKDRGVYLITGGTGGIGLALAEHLHKTVKARLVLVGREAPPPKTEWHRWLAPDRVDAAEAIAHLSRMESGIVDRVPLAPMSAIEGLDRTLDRLCAGYVLAFLAHCGVDASEPRVVDRQTLVAACRVLPKFERLFARMLKMLEAEGIATFDGASVRFTGAGARLTLAEERQQAMARYPQVAPLLELLDHCATHFHLALPGEIPAIGLLFGEDHVERFKRAVETIRDHSYVPLCQELVRELLAHVAERPRSGPLRVLEVGGGEGLLTQALLPSFEGRSVEYTFTDIGRSFVVNAERLAAQRGQRFMRFGVLDISRPPIEQGFASGSFDVVVAFNVMHATRSVAASLAHVRELLAPGGVLVLQESVRPAAWVDLIWGLTDGWWAFEDEPLRTVSPLIDLDAWSDVFRDAGFELVTSYPQSPAGRIAADTGVVVARKPLASQAQLVAADAASHNGHLSAMAQRIAALTRLDQQGADVEVIAADVADPASMRAAVDGALRRFGTIDGVIHAALVLNDGAMQVKTRDAVATVFAPKVVGTLVLKEVCEGLDLDFFVMFSSLVSQVGGAGQVDYCAASNFQDVFAHAERTGLARSVITVNWGAWREIGKAFRAAVERGAAPGQALPDGMSPGEGLEAFTRILASPRTQVLVSPVDPRALIGHAPRAPRSVAVLTQEDAPPAAAGATITPAGHDADRLAPRTDTERVIARIWQQILGVPQLGVLDNFFDLGGDSMISLQFIAEARKAGLRFTNRQVFEHQTIAELAAAAGARTTPAPEREGTA